ncbi:ATPase involved in chromosome partitioning [Beggiatoa alba B18LD]|uniref:ATPase involved in chromosome partitioning n=1 Tax=Beggiatoa alba B18LD TaxID=395493 RepID=I3CGN7_9GAMM|nr:division plane positioning ATPase MipZ [Beggiatoa alba]EIJ42780.1 ATPase involved in chromosome partitioning [Beggiatoa alba B18LD]
MITVIGNLKGGSGKSTVTFNLALWLRQAGKSVTAYDLDPQSTLCDAAQVRKEEGYEPALTIQTRHNKLEKDNSEQEILIDVSAANMAGMKKALSLANRIIIPVCPSQADLWSTQRFLLTIASLINTNAPPPQVLAFINRADTHSAIRETEETENALSSLQGIRVLKTRLCQRTVYRRSFSEGLAVYELEPSSKGAQEFEAFAQGIFGNLS